MNEGAKTGVFWSIALLLLTFAVVVARPRNEQDLSLNSVLDKPLFDGFQDATTAANLKIVKFNENQGELSSFSVDKNLTTGSWTIPSADGYPADANDQMRKAATAFVDTRILDIVSTTPDEHARFGVLDPSNDQREVSDQGVGTRVEIQDSERNDLVDIIVGDKVPGSENEVYVRKPTQDVVYRVKLSTDSLSTSFTDWIEKDLLKLGSIDIREVVLKNYAVLRTQQGLAVDQEFDAMLTVNDASEWSLKKFITYDDPKNPKESTELPQGKELDKTKLNELKNALDDLKIAGVRKKPAGLSAELKADAQLFKDQAALQSMFKRGFYPNSGENGNGEVYAANGELVVSLRDGVQYLLRFGEIEGVGKNADSSQDAEAATEESKEVDPAGLNRYLLVSVRLNEASFPPPDLKQVPQTIADLDKLLEERRLAAEPASKDSPDTKNVDVEMEETTEPPLTKPGSEDEPLPEALKEVTPGSEEDKTKSEKAVDDTGKSDEGSEEKVDAIPDASATNEESGSGSETASGGGALAQEESKVADADAGAATDDAKPVVDTDLATKPEKELTDQEKQELLEAEQEKITRENQRLIDERNEKLGKARQRVRELNARFADWYYVVPESTYRKLRLKQDDVLKPVSPSTPATGAGTTAPQK